MQHGSSRFEPVFTWDPDMGPNKPENGKGLREHEPSQQMCP